MRPLFWWRFTLKLNQSNHRRAMIMIRLFHYYYCFAWDRIHLENALGCLVKLYLNAQEMLTGEMNTGFIFQLWKTLLFHSCHQSVVLISNVQLQEQEARWALGCWWGLGCCWGRASISFSSLLAFLLFICWHNYWDGGTSVLMSSGFERAAEAEQGVHGCWFALVNMLQVQG